MNLLKVLTEERNRLKAGVSQYWLDQMVSQIQAANKGHQGGVIIGQVQAILQNDSIGDEFFIPGVNLVTNDGDRYYAERSTQQSVTTDFTAAAGGIRLGSANTTPTKTDTDVTTFLSGSGHAKDSGYPTNNDSDSNNTGAGVDIATWRFTYTTAEGNVSGIQEGAIVDNRTTPTKALAHFLFGSSFTKTSSDTLVIFVNQTFTGV